MLATRKSKFAAAAVASTVLLGGGSTAFASTPSTPAGGIIHVFINVNGKSQTVDPTLITGVIGDYGTSTSTTQAGKVDPNGN